VGKFQKFKIQNWKLEIKKIAIRRACLTYILLHIRGYKMVNSLDLTAAVSSSDVVVEKK